MKLFIAGLPFDMDNEELNAIFSDYGTVKSAGIVHDRQTQLSRGFGFVEFIKKEDAEKAMEALHKATIDGRAITVRPAQDKPQTSRRHLQERH